MDRRKLITTAAALPVTLPLLPVSAFAQPADDPAAAAERLAEFQRLLGKLDNREVAKLEAFMRSLSLSAARGAMS